MTLRNYCVPIEFISTHWKVEDDRLSEQKYIIVTFKCSDFKNT